jgi:hypothetical protein
MRSIRPTRARRPSDASVDHTEASQPVVRRPDGRPGSQQIGDLPGESIVEYLGVIGLWANQRRTSCPHVAYQGPRNPPTSHRKVALTSGPISGVHYTESLGSWQNCVCGPGGDSPRTRFGDPVWVDADGIAVLKGSPRSPPMSEVVPSFWKGWSPMLLRLPRRAGRAGTPNLGWGSFRSINHLRRADAPRLVRARASGSPGLALRFLDALSDDEPAIVTGTVWNRSDLVGSWADRENLGSS